ncbi:hypothetical protein TCAL_07354 [Tigriopus californicus]|uniref:Uncharacterized protein n=1 Tax=Tigriopus californicus TaxID=6832 RepID=A0A553NXI1_TIGCA|nr:hypothetical protein TCAL_07354 [Tigriopus californicus]
MLFACFPDRALAAMSILEELPQRRRTRLGLHLRSLTTPKETETGSGNNEMKKVPQKTSNESPSENASGVKLKQAPLKAKNPKQIKEQQLKREEPELGVKVKKKPILELVPVLEENVDAKSLYEEARNHLKKTKEFKPGSKSKLTPSSKDNDEDDEDNNNPVERLIRQNSRLKDKTAVGDQSIKVQVMPELLCSKLASVLPCPLSSC